MEVLILTVLLAIAGFYDVKERKIPNFLILSGWLAAFFYRLISEGGGSCFRYVAAVIITIIICFPFFLLRVIGAGDIKLLSVIGAMHGLELLGQVVLVWIMVAGIVSLILMLQRKLLLERFRHIWFYITVGRLGGVPYYEKERDGVECTMVLAPIMFLAYLLVQLGRRVGFC